jgi:hypothetical protein
MSKRMSITLPNFLAACVEQEAKDCAISEAAVVRMRLKESYDREATQTMTPTLSPPIQCESAATE